MPPPTVGDDISVCLLSYNHAATIREAVESALRQTAPAAEVIVSDDGSTDGTWDVLLAIAEREPRVRPVRTPSNRGMAGNANFAVSLASRPFVALLHHDDVHREDLLERWGAVMARHADVAFVFNRYEEGGRVSTETYPERMEGGAFLHGRLLRGWDCPVRGTALIRRTCWEAAGGMREEFGLLADVDMWMRLAARGAVGFADAPLIRVRHERPEGYPEEYVELSWRRNRLLYEIHAANAQAGLPPSPRRALRRLRQRVAISADALKWLAYASLRQPRVLARAEEGRTPLELLPVRVARTLATRWARRSGAGGG